MTYTRLVNGERKDITQEEYDASQRPESARAKIVQAMIISRDDFAINAAKAKLISAQEAEEWAGGTSLPSVITEALAEGIKDDDERLTARIKALTADNIKRVSPIIALAQAKLSLSDEQVDELFVVEAI